MGALETNTTLIYGVHLRESANDGSDFSNAASDYRVLFLGEDGFLHAKDSAGSVTDPYDTSGGAVNAGTPYEVDYVQFTSAVSVTATTEGGADTVVTASAVAFDGSTIGVIEFFSPGARPDTAGSTNAMTIVLYDGSSSIGTFALVQSEAGVENRSVFAMRRLTPSNASHTYSVRAFVNNGTGNVGGGAGGSGNSVPGFIRISKLTA